MNCDRFSQYIDDLVDGELDHRLKAECEEHIQSCSSCKQIFDNYMFMITSLNEFGDLENSDIEFPSDLHTRIMSSVIASSISSDDEATAEPNIINILQKDLGSENIVNINETSSDQVIDLTKEFSKNNTDKDEKELAKKVEIENEKQQVNKTSSKISFYKRYSNSLVAGFVTIFVATGAYQTYQYLRSPSVMQTPMLSVDIGSSKSEYGSQDTNQTANSESMDADEAPEINASILSESTDQSSEPIVKENSQPTTGRGTDSVAPDEVKLVPNEPLVVSSNQQQSADEKVSTPAEQSVVAKSAPVPQAAAAAPTLRSAKLEIPEFNISINSDDLDAYIEYLSSSPDFVVNSSSPANGTIKVNGSSKNFEKFIEFAKQYSEIENPRINIEYSEETLAKIKETGQFNFTIQQN